MVLVLTAGTADVTVLNFDFIGNFMFTAGSPKTFGIDLFPAGIKAASTQFIYIKRELISAVATLSKLGIKFPLFDVR